MCDNEQLNIGEFIAVSPKKGKSDNGYFISQSPKMDKLSLHLMKMMKAYYKNKDPTGKVVGGFRVLVFVTTPGCVHSTASNIFSFKAVIQTCSV